MDLRIKDKRAIVTGATRGIGRRIAEGLAAEGVRLAICARKADEVEATVAALGGAAIGRACDVADPESYRGFLDWAAAELGGVDMFVPTVSAGGGGAADAFWKRNLDADILGAVRGVEALGPHLEASKGSVVFIASTAAVETFLMPQAYNAMKAALITYGKQLAMAWGPKGVRVNVVSPGSIYFEGGSWARIEKERPQLFEAIKGGVAMGRLGSPEEVADVVVFLLSPRAGWVTGANVIVDGGQTKRVQF